MRSPLSIRRKLVARAQECQKVCDDLDDERRFAEINAEPARSALDKFDLTYPDVERLMIDDEIGG